MTETAAGHQDSFPPSAEFAAAANADAALYQRGETDRDGFWAEQANRLHWHKPFTEVLDWTDAPVARWFGDGELNVSYN
ncbi:acetyl-coenzyme A synthetase N-terminal domain-containing protein, partial [Nocardia salmonicida]